MHACYRIHRSPERGDKPKKHSESFRLTDEHTGQEAANCGLSRNKVFTAVEILDGDNRTWQMHPNRKIMPSRWVVTDPQQRIVMQFDQKILAKLVNPIYRTVLVLLAEDGREVFRLVDPTTNIGDKMFSINIGDWAILRGDEPVARLTRLRQPGQTAGGVLGKIRRWLKSSDFAIVSAGEAHVLPAPVALCMYLVFRELYDPSS